MKRLLSVKILGVKVSLVDYETTIALMKECISRHFLGRYICACPVYSIMLSQRDRKLRYALNDSWLTVPDGMPVAWAARLLGASIKNNVRGTNLMLRSCEAAEAHDYSVFLYGGKPQTLKKLEMNLLRRFPGLHISGVYSPPFRRLSSEEDTRIREMIDLASPDILFIGLGAPIQEKWMADHCQRIKVPVTMGVGAAFDFLAGEKWQAPNWMQARGLEWLHRFSKEPARLWRRYVFNNPLFIFLLLQQMISAKLHIKLGKSTSFRR